MQKIYIVAAKRSAIGSFGGSFVNTPAAKLGAEVIKDALAQAKLSPSDIDEVIVGNVLGAGQGMGPARQAALGAGIPQTTPAYGINMICGSGMKSVIDACCKIKAGDANIVVAAGMENMSRAPFLLPADNRFGHKMGNQQLIDSLVDDGLTDIFNHYHMGVTAENIVEKHNISRAEQDAFSLASQQKALAAIAQGKFKDEITPIEVTIKRQQVIMQEDEYPKKNASLEGLQKLRPAFKKDGCVTAGNSSGINDGAVALIVASEEIVKAKNLTPLCEIVSYGQGGVDPKVMGLGPVPAIKKALAKGELKLTDIDVLELNEAFAAQALGVMTELCESEKVSMDWFSNRTNLNGGAIALGHPLGASGGRILTTLIYEMKRQQASLGLASLCIGGGMGTAIIVKNC